MACTVDPLKTPLELVRGDAAEYLFTCREVPDGGSEDDVEIVNLGTATDGTVARPAVVRFAVKSSPDVQTNRDAIVFKASYRADEVAVLAQSGATLGQLRVIVDTVDTEDAFPGKYHWDLEVAQQGDERAGASGGTITLTSGSTTVLGVGTAFTKAKRYDILQPLGGNAAQPARIVRVVSDTELVVDHPLWITGAPEAFEVRRSRTRTVMAGPFTLKSGVVAE